MCGIIGIIGKNDISDRLLNGLKNLEYRGYDSAGIATIHDKEIHRRRAEGKLINLSHEVSKHPIKGSLGIGHTRWATHGVPNETNAHPHATNMVAAVHNGIIENFQTIKEELGLLGYKFQSDTDSEAIVHLISYYLDKGLSPKEAFSNSLNRLEGAYAIALIFSSNCEKIYGARSGSPLAVGWGDNEMFLGSDAAALSNETTNISYLEEGDLVELSRDGANFWNKLGEEVKRDIVESKFNPIQIGKGNFPHYMLKEIYEQPTVIGDTLNTFFNPADSEIKLPSLGVNLAKISKVTIVACGSSYYAGLVAKFWIERYARVSVEVDISSEFRYRETPLPKDGLTLFISQSGETADTLAALRYAKSQSQHIVSLVNVRESTIARESDGLLLINAGPEIGVASTKAFTCQLVALAVFTISLGVSKKIIDKNESKKLSKAISEVSSKIADILQDDLQIKSISDNFSDVSNVLYIARGSEYPIALEGALKLKEVSYIHSEGFAAGELKHGPIALIEKGVPVIVIAPEGPLYEKTISNMQEVIARGAKVIIITDSDKLGDLDKKVWKIVSMPKVDNFVNPILYSIPVQLIAYHVAVSRGADVDQPRNLAKSVTVE
ncbi:MAG: glutamine--fructose-6-phosphate transaminase (isomerizing) [Rhodospirillaceae bacterium]|nr:glutamine--fructose-6-phosphate transaminase (isomerizing) [Rhodospirillaceae bacterium]|tara:strand:- start:844 stop:2667 length:1824 start_codon:yes stop_codon:yes gene_type:complete